VSGQLDDLRTALRHKRREWEAVWFCLDCGKGGLRLSEMGTEVPGMETLDGDPVGSCKECYERTIETFDKKK
jgi:hypothetical protein